MKKIAIIAGIILTIIIIGIFFIQVQEQDTDIIKEQTKIGVILNGKITDKSWTQSHYEALETIKEELNLQLYYKEHVEENEKSIKVMEDLIKEGCEIIICNSFGYGEWELQVAKKYPEIYFFHAAGVGENKNMASYFGRIYQMRYLSGIVAGLQTESNKIGYVAAFPISEVNRGINAFTLGVRLVNPDAEVYVEWCNSWTDDDVTETATNKLLVDNPDIDVLAMHTDSLRVLDIAEQKGIWSIGYNMDNSKDYPNTFLTAPVWEWENFYKPRIRECLQGKFEGTHYWEGVETGIVSLVPFTKNVKTGITEIVEAERKRLESATFDVFYGPVKDNEGNLRVAKGENLSDEIMLNEFDWYVEGVVLNESK